MMLHPSLFDATENHLAVRVVWRVIDGRNFTDAFTTSGYARLSGHISLSSALSDLSKIRTLLNEQDPYSDLARRVAD
jgi:hypothetical protein